MDGEVVKDGIQLYQRVLSSSSYFLETNIISFKYDVFFPSVKQGAVMGESRE